MYRIPTCIAEDYCTRMQVDEELCAEHLQAKWRKIYLDTTQRARRNSRLKTLYGMTIEQYEAMVEHQGGKCAICEVTPLRGLVIDHNHGNGEARGLLCHSCNTGMGHLGDSPSRLISAAMYLTAYTSERA